jgi:predicted RNA-binding Zn ribbon-like protein
MHTSRDQAGGDIAFVLVGASPSLNLLATLGRRHATPVERIPDAAALARWLIAAGLLPTAPPLEHTDVLQARRLREAINTLMRSTMSGNPLSDEPLEIVNAHALQPDLSPQLRIKHGTRTITTPPNADAPAALATIARDAVRLLGGAQAARIKECEHPDCSLLFLDETQSARRRWCSMTRCGNRVKTAHYRARRQRAD